MSLCINPLCPHPQNSDDQLFCKGCKSEVLLEGRYRVLELLGQGGCGKTYEISDLDGSRKVLKILSKNEPKHVELFLREAQVLSQLQHPGIPTVDPNAYFTYLPKNAADPLHCLVMEKITGLDLQKYLRQRGSPVDQLLAVQWLIQLTKILQAVHQQKFLHRDIKPSNIMLKADGHLVLIDFGTVRTITTVYAPGQDASTQATRIMSALYTPNEQIKGKPVPQSDFFALGRTFVYLLTGRDLGELYDPETDELLWRETVPNLSLKLADFLDGLMAPMVAQRPANADVMLQQLNEIQREFYLSSAILTPTQTSDAAALQRLENATTQLAAHHAIYPNGQPPTQPPSIPQAPISQPPLSQPPLSQPPLSQPPLSQPQRISSTGPSSQPLVDSAFVAHCQQSLAELIGPIAAIVCQRTLARHPVISQNDFVEELAAQIPSRQDAQTFRQRLGLR